MELSMLLKSAKGPVDIEWHGHRIVMRRWTARASLRAKGTRADLDRGQVEAARRIMAHKPLWDRLRELSRDGRVDVGEALHAMTADERAQFAGLIEAPVPYSVDAIEQVLSDLAEHLLSIDGQPAAEALGARRGEALTADLVSDGIPSVDLAVELWRAWSAGCEPADDQKKSSQT